MVTVIVVGARDVAGASPSSPSPVNTRKVDPPGAASGSPGKAKAILFPWSQQHNSKSTDGGSRSSNGSAGQSRHSSNVDPFVEMRFGRDVHRTPFVHRNATHPVWNWSFHCRLAADIPPATTATTATASNMTVLRDDLLRFTICNAMTIGEPELLCMGQVRPL